MDNASCVGKTCQRQFAAKVASLNLNDFKCVIFFLFVLSIRY